MTDPLRRAGALLLTRNLPPLRGGMERLNHQIATALQQKFQLAVCGPVGSTAFLPGATEVRERSPLLWRFLPGCLVSAIGLAWKHRPVLVMAGSGLTGPIAWLVARLFGAQAVAFLHGLDLVVESPAYRFFWLPFLRRLDLVLVNSSNTRRLAIRAGIPEERLSVLHPGTTVPGVDQVAGNAFRSALGLGSRPIMLSVGRLTPRKGLASFVQRALPKILAERPEALLLVIGADARDALNRTARSELERIRLAADEAGVAASIIWMPPCDDEKLAGAYHAADVHVFPVQDIPGDVEGFGMVAIESAAHGTPTVAFAVGGVPDAVVHGASGTLVSPADYDAFSLAVATFLEPTQRDAWAERCVETARAFSWERFAERLDELVASVVEEK